MASSVFLSFFKTKIYLFERERAPTCTCEQEERQRERKRENLKQIPHLSMELYSMLDPTNLRFDLS